MRKLKVYYLLLFKMVLISAFWGCQSRDKKGNVLDTPTSGEMSIAIDESLKPLLEAEIATFEGIYKHAKLVPHYLPEGKAIQELLSDSDSVRVVIVSRHLSKQEAGYIEQQNLKVYTIPIAIDAIALLVNKQNPDTLLTYTQLLGIIKGEIRTWAELTKTNDASGIKVVFDNPNSSIARFMMDSVAHIGKLPGNCFALDSNPKVIDYVSANRDAIGLIGLSWISDTDDSVSRELLDKVKLVSLSSSQTKLGPIAYYGPSQDTMAQKIYPLRREVYVISKEARAGLGNGFIAFLASDRGQRIVLKSGLLPVKMPERTVELSNRNLFKNQ